MRPPTEVERVAVFLAAMAVTPVLLPRSKQPTRNRPSGEPAKLRPARVFVGDRDAATATYRARYGANNAREN